LITLGLAGTAIYAGYTLTNTAIEPATVGTRA
jgi:hypothetical protein